MKTKYSLLDEDNFCVKHLYVSHGDIDSDLFNLTTDKEVKLECPVDIIMDFDLRHGFYKCSMKSSSGQVYRTRVISVREVPDSI